MVAANALFYTSSYIALNKAWYADYEKTGFHFFNDNSEWNQMDKAGHVWSTYQVSRWSAGMWKWTGLNPVQSAVAGGVTGMAYQSIVELQDAYSAAWGFSWGDMAANLAGAGTFVAQDLAWNEQRIQFKMGFYPYRYPSALTARRNELFGTSTAERLLKDYNSQTYWVSGNLRSLVNAPAFPKWLNVAVGYSAEGLYGGRANYWKDDEGREFDYRHIARLRKFYLSPDIDLTRINVRKKWVRSVLSVVNSVKIPAPALELRDGHVSVVVR